jgi:hypothetical protein
VGLRSRSPRSSSFVGLLASSPRFVGFPLLLSALSFVAPPFALLPVSFLWPLPSSWLPLLACLASAPAPSPWRPFCLPLLSWLLLLAVLPSACLFSCASLLAEAGAGFLAGGSSLSSSGSPSVFCPFLLSVLRSSLFLRPLLLLVVGLGFWRAALSVSSFWPLPLFSSSVVLSSRAALWLRLLCRSVGWLSSALRWPVSALRPVGGSQASSLASALVAPLCKPLC